MISVKVPGMESIPPGCKTISLNKYGGLAGVLKMPLSLSYTRQNLKEICVTIIVEYLAVNSW